MTEIHTSSGKVYTTMNTSRRIQSCGLQWVVALLKHIITLRCFLLTRWLPLEREA